MLSTEHVTSPPAQSPSPGGALPGTEGAAGAEFEIDEEMMEVFRYEAEELLGGIATNIAILESSPADKTALWEIRRCAHTFKGAAGIVGFSPASKLAHRLEDLLDKLVENNSGVNASHLELFRKASAQLCSFVEHPNNTKSAGALDADFVEAIDGLSEASQPEKPSPRPDPSPGPPVKPLTPVLRIALPRLDQLLDTSQDLLSAIESLQRARTRSEALASGTTAIPELDALIYECLARAKTLQERVRSVRLLRIGNLHSRLGAVINAASIEENKRTQFVFETPEVEIDTRIIDVLIEPVLHLLRNAVVHGIEAPEVRAGLGKSEVGRVAISVSVAGGWIAFTVSDDGAGLSPDRLRMRSIETGALTPEQAWQMTDDEALQLIFTEGLSTADRLSMSAGRGIGMNIVREVVEAHKGNIDLASEAGKGTNITILLPETYTATAPAAATPSINASGEAPYILIVDDSPTIRKRNTDVIQDAKIRVVSAVNGAEALTLLQSAKTLPTLIVSDVEMPVMNGWGLLKNLKQDKRLRDIPLVMLTSLDTTSSRSTAAQLGASGYLIKPLTAEAFAKVLSTVAIVA